ncbi:MAG: Fic family protein [Acholeplasmatales bacterium]|nr:Fic family protein [Acholeplasmatales bacterium]
MYKPPFTISSKMLDKAISITEKIGKITNFQNLKRMPILRKNNMIKSIHSSLAIENNSLSLDQVRDTISGKLVLGDKKEIQEVKNAYAAYEAIDSFDCFKENDLLLAHKMLTNLIVDDNGKYRNHAEGVFDGEKVIFVAPPANMVSELMNNLFDWLKNDTETPLLIKSCIFHYEFVFIHPFTDGNGRCARLWQNVILMKWNNLFKYVPIESVIEKYQANYYDVISNCHKNGNSNQFIEFMLDVIDETLTELLDNVKKEESNISDQVNKLLEVMEYGIPYSANELLSRLNIKSKETLRASYLNPAIENGLVRMTLGNKPNSKNQKYIK